MTRKTRLYLGSCLVAIIGACGAAQRPEECSTASVDALKKECSARRDSECPNMSDAECPVVAECDRRLEEMCPTW